MNTIKGFSLLLILGVSYSFTPPSGWRISGNKASSYEMTTDKNAGIDSSDCATIKSVESSIKGFGTLMQTISASKFANKKIKLGVYMKSSHISIRKWAGFWVNVDGKISTATIQGDKELNKTEPANNSYWKQYEIVFDVPASAIYISFGAQFAGTGQLWFDNISFTVLEETLSKKNTLDPLPAQFNLDFEK